MIRRLGTRAEAFIYDSVTVVTANLCLRVLIMLGYQRAGPVRFAVKLFDDFFERVNKGFRSLGLFQFLISPSLFQTQMVTLGLLPVYSKLISSLAYDIY